MKANDIYNLLKGKVHPDEMRVLMRMVEDHSTLKQVCNDLQKQTLEIISVLRVVASEMTTVSVQVEGMMRASGHTSESLQQFYSEDIDDVVGEDGKKIQ